MSYKQELAPVYSATSSEIKPLDERLKEAITKRATHGITGINNWNAQNKPDGTVSFKEYYMHPHVFELGCEILNIDVDMWAAWMTNTEMESLADTVVFYSPNSLYAEQAGIKLGDVIKAHCKKHVRFKIDKNLGRIMDKR
jgi:hypothetical protein